MRPTTIQPTAKTEPAMNTSLPLKVVICRVGEPSLGEFGASRVSLDSPQSIFNFWQTVIKSKPDFEPDKEHLVAILLDTRLCPKGYHIVAIGSINECTAHPREIFRPIIIDSAYAFILAHNHPSGDSQPSTADRHLTSRIREGAELLQITFIDHIIIGRPSPGCLLFFSFRDAGLL